MSTERGFTDTPPDAPLPGEHPRSLRPAALAAFLSEQLGVREDVPGTLADKPTPKHFALPTASGRPLPSFEMLPYAEEDTPEEFERTAWKVCCYPLPKIISGLNEFQFTALNAAEGFQLGQDIVFWQQHAQALRGVIARDQYIPRLAYRELRIVQTRQGQ